MLISLFVYISYSIIRSIFWRIHMDWINKKELYHRYTQYNKLDGYTSFNLFNLDFVEAKSKRK